MGYSDWLFCLSIGETLDSDTNLFTFWHNFHRPLINGFLVYNLPDILVFVPT